VPRRLETWRTELAAICAVVVSEFLELGGAFRSARWHAPHRDALQLAVESVVLAAVHDKLMGGVQRLCERADDAMDDALARLARLPPTLLGVRREWADAAVEPEVLRRFRQLPHLVMPYEKVVCVRDTVRKLVENVQNMRTPHRRRKRRGGGASASPSPAGSGAAPACGEEVASSAAASSSGGGGGGGYDSDDGGAGAVPMPCADDVLSLMVVLLARGRVRHLVASAVYMDTFLCMTEATSHKGELGYALANFMAACEYCRSKDVARLCAEWEENGRAWEAQMRADGAQEEEDAEDDAATAAAAAAGDAGAAAGSEGGEAAPGGGRRARDPLGVLSGAAAAAVAAAARPPVRRMPTPPMSTTASPLAGTTPGAGGEGGEPSLDAPWLLPPNAPPAPPPPVPHSGVVLEKSRGAADSDPLGALHSGVAGAAAGGAPSGDSTDGDERADDGDAAAAGEEEATALECETPQKPSVDAAAAQPTPDDAMPAASSSPPPPLPMSSPPQPPAPSPPAGALASESAPADDAVAAAALPQEDAPAPTADEVPARAAVEPPVAAEVPAAVEVPAALESLSLQDD
jgi:hypothetical protein